MMAISSSAGDGQRGERRGRSRCTKHILLESLGDELPRHPPPAIRHRHPGATIYPPSINNCLIKHIIKSHRTMALPMKPLSTFSTLLGCIISLPHHSVHRAAAFSLTITRPCSPPTALQLAWYDDGDYDEENYNRRPVRTASAGRSRTRGSTGRNNNDWEGDRRSKRQQKHMHQQQRVFPRTNIPLSTASIDCPHFGTCPGCVVNSTIADIDIIQSAKLYFSSLSVQKHILPSKLHPQSLYEEEDFFKVRIPSSVTGWRSQAKLAAAPKSTWSRDSGANIGLYARASHKVLSIPDCKVHHPSINKAVDMIVEASRKVRTPIYQEDIGVGLLRYVQCKEHMLFGY